MTTEKKKGQRLDKLRPSKKVLLFGSNMILAAIVKSVRTAADILSSGGGKTCSPTNVSFAANGKQMTANGYYVRYENENVEVELSDIGKLALPIHDRMCGEKRNYNVTLNYLRKYKIKNKNV